MGYYGIFSMEWWIGLYQESSRAKKIINPHQKGNIPDCFETSILAQLIQTWWTESAFRFSWTIAKSWDGLRRIFLWNLFDNQLKAGKSNMSCPLTNFGLFWQIAFEDTMILCTVKSQIHFQWATRKKIKTWEPTHIWFSRFGVMIESPAKVRGRLDL